MTAHPSHPRRYLALWFPFLSIDRWLRMTAPPGGAPDEPLVLTQSIKGALRLAAVSREALALGLTPGLTLADARARIPTLAVAEHDPAADAALLGRMAEACDRWTPLVALDPPDGLVLDVTGCAHLFGGEAGLRERVVLGFRKGGSRRGVSTRGALAGTPEAARALVRFGRASVVSPGGEEAAVRPLPVTALGLAEADRAALALAGLKRVADLADLPSRPLAARFGEDVATRLRRVLGREDRRITPLRPPPACRVEQRFLEPIAHRQAIERCLRHLIERAATLLETAGRGGRVFEASFFRSDGEVRRIAVETGRPCREPAAILRLLHERLDALADPLDPGYGFDLIRLGVPVAEPLAPVQRSFEGAEHGARPSEPPADSHVDRSTDQRLNHNVFPLPLAGRGQGVGVVQDRPVRCLLRHPHLLPPPRKGEERGDASAAASLKAEPFERNQSLEDDASCRFQGISPFPPRPLPRTGGALAEPDPGSSTRRREASIGLRRPYRTDRSETVSDLVDRLVARFGIGRVVRFVAVDTHDPLRAARLVPATQSPAQPAEWSPTEAGDPPLRPLQLFEPPQPIETLAEVPDGPPIRFRWRRVLHNVVRAEGPERISAEWWREAGTPTRDYFRVEDEAGRRFWLFRAGLYGSETDRPRWFLHGLFA